jgi:hypothetical protein
LAFTDGDIGTAAIETAGWRHAAIASALNRMAKSVVEGCGGAHEEFVVTTQERDGTRHPQFRMNNSGWKAARRRAAASYEQELAAAIRYRQRSALRFAKLPLQPLQAVGLVVAPGGSASSASSLLSPSRTAATSACI